MVNASKGFEILIAEDDDDDYLLIQEGMHEAKVSHSIKRVKDGEELMKYLLRPLGNGNQKELPGLILLDLNMPKKGGREALGEIKSNPDLRRIPIVVLTTSNAPEDISLTYQLGVNSFIQKPLRFEDMVQFLKVLDQYWFQTVKLPVQ